MSSKGKAGKASYDALPPDEDPCKRQALNKRRRPSQCGEDLSENDIQRLANLRQSRVKLPIAKCSSENVRNIGDKEYEFNVPFSELTAFRRTAWGVRLDAESVHVYLRFWLDNQKQCTSFCVHYLPSTRNPEDRHKHIPSDIQADFACPGESNFLTAALSPRLHSLIRGDWSEKKSFDAIREVASANPTATCIIYGKRLGCKVYRPVPCSPSCREKFSVISLATRLSPFLRDPPALDLLLCCLAPSTYDETELPSNGNYGKFRPNPNFQTNLPSPTYPVAKE